MPAFINSISENPAPLFDNALERLIATSRHADNPVRPPKTFSLVFQDTPGFYANTDVRSGIITIRRGVMSLFRDISELHSAYEALYAFDGSLVRGADPDKRGDQKRCHPLGEELCQDLRFGGRMKGCGSVSWKERSGTPAGPAATRETAPHFFLRLISLACFVVAHELAHILRRHRPSWNPLRRCKSSENMGLEADQIAAKWVLDYIYIPPTVIIRHHRSPVGADCGYDHIRALVPEQESEWHNGSLESVFEAISAGRQRAKCGLHVGV